MLSSVCACKTRCFTRGFAKPQHSHGRRCSPALEKGRMVPSLKLMERVDLFPRVRAALGCPSAGNLGLAALSLGSYSMPQVWGALCTSLFMFVYHVEQFGIWFFL